MPAGDGTGPRGTGPIGWGRGPCGAGLGRLSWAGGYGRRGGLVGRGRLGGYGDGWRRAAGPGYGVAPQAQYSEEQERSWLRDQASELDIMLDQVRRRLAELGRRDTDEDRKKR